MSRVCLVSNFNYAAFLPKAIDSALEQTVSFDRILVVDDGSSDGSSEVLRRYEGCSPIEIIRKQNAGQLSCFHAVIDRVSPEDWIFLLDADDLYPHDYVEVVLEVLAGGPLKGLGFASVTTFHQDSDAVVSACSPGESTSAAHHFPMSSAITRLFHCWIGSPTSAMFVSGRAFLDLLPYPFESDWRTRADDVLVLGTSILGFEKVYLPSIRVGYRVHGNNGFYGRCMSRADEAKRSFRLERLYNFYCRKALVSTYPPLGQVANELPYFSGELRRKFFIPRRLARLRRAGIARLCGSQKFE